MKKQVIGMFLSDIHLSEFPPSFRVFEKDWLRTQENYFVQLIQLQESLGYPPVFISGDIFNKWDSSPHIINYAIKWLSKIKDLHGIPGNHDLPNHNFKEIQRSAYWTLVEANVIKHLTPGTAHAIGQVLVSPFPYGFDIKPPNIHHSLVPNIALIHSFIWVKDHTYKDATEVSRYGSWIGKLPDYDVAFFGDNHSSFTILGKDSKLCKVVNCGCYIRRRSNEATFKPSIHLLNSDLTIIRHYLDISQDVCTNIELAINDMGESLKIDLEEFADELEKLHGEKLDFVKTVMFFCQKNKVPDGVKDIMLRSIGGKK